MPLAAQSTNCWPFTCLAMVKNVAMVLILLLVSHCWCQDDKPVKCDFATHHATGCGHFAFCDISSNSCLCNETVSFAFNGRCLPYSSLGDYCILSEQCSVVRGICVNTRGEEMTEQRAADGMAEANNNTLTGYCKCLPGHYFNQEFRTCFKRILDSKCYLSDECFSKNHASCENGKCRCKGGFFLDYLSDECRPNLVTTLCLYGYYWDKGSHKCRPSSKFPSDAYHSPESSISALFWPAIAFFLVIFLLRLLKEGMKRDCGQASEINRVRRHHRIIRPCAYPSTLAASQLPGGRGPRQSAEVVVLMPSTLPPPYTAHGSEPTYPTDEPPSYEEATRSDVVTSQVK
ncbi:hypothetical protein HDE_08660 [Halotydeus destructor]|nr:hypothetical protein HDE_08660 [Halotydeus destructor]